MINKIASNWLGNKFVFYPSLEIHMQFSSSFASCRLWRDVRTSKTYLINVQPSTDLLASGLGSKKNQAIEGRFVPTLIAFSGYLLGTRSCRGQRTSEPAVNTASTASENRAKRAVQATSASPGSEDRFKSL